MNLKIFFTRYKFWIIVAGIIIGVYGYGMWFRYNTVHNIETLLRSMFGKTFDLLANVPSFNELMEDFKSSFDSTAAFKDFKNSEYYQLMEFPQKILFNLAFATKKTMPLAIAIIVLIALVIRTNFSATIDMYAAERQAALDEIRGVQPIEVKAKIIDAEPIQQINENSSIKQLTSYDIDKEDSMDIF